MRLIILRGIPGSGKSTFARKELPKADLIASADDGMMEGEKYVFNPAKLPAAHGACLLSVIEHLQDGYAQRELAKISGVRNPVPEPVIVVDNTSTSVAEIAPYVAVGQAFGAEVVIMTLRIDPAIAGPRNTHGVPQVRVDRMAAALDEGTKGMMPWWDHELLLWDPETSRYQLPS
jgi:hypothetical protein